MKKRLEADLISIAHRILQIKDKSDVNLLCNETRRLYEKLAILRFVEEHFGEAKPTIGQAEIVEKMKQFFEDYDVFELKPNKMREKTVADEVIIDDEVEELLEQVAEIESEEEETKPKEEEITVDLSTAPNDIEFQPAFVLDGEEEVEEPNKSEEVQISFLDLLGGDYSETLFVKVDEDEEIPPVIAFEMAEETDFSEEKEEELIANIELDPKDIEPKAVSLNEKLAKGITVDLNDRIAFVKHLFGNSDEDFNRVLNQLITYDSFEEAQSFIEDMVKPDYDNWEGKEDYAQRFIEIIEKKFA